MDHKFAEETRAVEQYILDEMSPAERLQFEEHLFDCPICSEQVRQTFSVTENLTDVLREDDAFRAHSKWSAAGKTNWFEWRTWVPSLAALVLVGIVMTQQKRLDTAEEARILPPSSVLTPVSRGVGSVLYVDKNAPFFVATFMVDAAAPNSYICDFVNSEGHPVLSLATGPEEKAAFSLPIVLPLKSFPAGKYEMRLHQASEPVVATSYRFTIVMEN